MTSRVRSIAVWISVIGMVVVVLTAAVLHRQILETWHLKRLESSDAEVVADAARRLGALGSMKGLAALLRLEEEGAWKELKASYDVETLSQNSAAVLDEVIAAFEETDPAVHERAAMLLERLGPAARPRAVTLLRHSSDLAGEVRLEVIQILSRVLVGAPEMMDDVIEALAGREHDVLLTIQYVIQSAVLWAPELLPRLLDGLGDPSVLIRVKVAETIGSLGERAKEAVPHLVKSLGDESQEVRWAAARALGGMGEFGGAAAGDLLPLFADPATNVRSMAALSIAVIARESTGAMDEILSALAAGEAAIRSGAARALGLVGEAAVARGLVPLAKSCRDPAEEVRHAAVVSLGQLDVYSDVVVSALLESLDDSSTAVRRAAVRDLSKSGWDTAVLVPAFIGRLEDEDDDVREAASHALRLAARSDPTSVIEAASDLKSRPERVRHGLIFALSNGGPETESIIIGALDDPEPSIRLLALQSLAFSESDITALLPRLLSRLDDPIEEVRDTSSQVIAALATKSVDASLPAVLGQLEARSERARAGAALALAHMGAAARDAVPALIGGLRDVSTQVRLNAALALGEIGAVDASAAPALMRLLEDEADGARHGAISALAKIALGTEQGLAAVLIGVADDSPRIREGTLHALFHVKDDGRVRAAFFAALRDPDLEVRRTAAGLLGDFEPLLEGSIEHLIGALADASWQVRVAAVSSLGRSGGAAREAVPALVPLLEDPDGDVRDMVVAALVYIVRDAPEGRSHLEAAREGASNAVRRGVEKVLEALSSG